MERRGRERDAREKGLAPERLHGGLNRRGEGLRGGGEGDGNGCGEKGGAGRGRGKAGVKGVEVGGADDGDRGREHGAGWTESGQRKGGGRRT